MSFIATLALFAITTILQELIRPKPEFENARPANLGDFQFPTSTEGRACPVMVGTVRMPAPNTGWYGDLQQIPIRVKRKTGLFSSTRQTVGYRYHIGFQLDYCLGTVSEVKRIWYGPDILVDTPQVGSGTIAIDEPEFLGGEDLGAGGLVGNLSFRDGSQTSANTYLDSGGHQSISGETPQYRGIVQLIWEGGLIGTSTSVKAFIPELVRIPDGLDLATPRLGVNNVNAHIVNDDDANPANWIYEILTDSRWGLSEPGASINLDSFREAGGTWALEGNGISMVIDSQRDALEILQEVERQTDSYLYFDQADKQWKINLVRGGYTIASEPQITDANALEVESFTRAGWEDTTNEVRIGYADRAKEYGETFATAHDGANWSLQGERAVTATEQYPGVKDATLANAIAWRSLRTLSFPIARVSVRVDRTFYSLVPGDIVGYSSARLGLTQMPMRVQRINYGTLDDSNITLELVQDLFEATAGSYADPAGTGWTAPTANLVAIPAAESVVIEAPRALIVRDPDNVSPVLPNRVFAGASYQGDGAVDFRIHQDASGSYIEDGTVSGFLFLGELNAALGAGTSNPTSVGETITLDTSNFDSETDIFNSFTIGAADEDTGVSLVNLIYIDGEFLAVQSASDGGTDLVDLDTVYRGMLDTVPKDHASGTKVFMVMEASGLSETQLGNTESFNVKLRSRGFDGSELTESAATTIALTFEDRYRAPYPPTNLELNTDAWGAATVDLDDLFTGGTSSDFEDWGLQVEFTRRDFRVVDEVDNINTDAVTRDANFLTDTTTEYQVSVYNDPTGTNNLLLTKTWDGTSGNNRFDISRTEILNAMTTPGTVPSELRVVVQTRHTDITDGTSVIEALQDIDYNFDTQSSALADDTNMGALAQNAWGLVTSNAQAGTYNIAIGSAFPTNGAVEYRINGGSAVSAIAFGSTTGTIPGLSAGNTLEIRHTSSDGSLEKFVQVSPPSGTAGAYAIFI